jgi:hypothetical protein
MHTDLWVIKVFLDDDETQCWADARLVVGGRERERGYGAARRRPADRYDAEIGAQLATSRALSDLARRLARAAESGIEHSTDEPDRVHP